MKINDEILKKAAEEYALKYGTEMLEKADKLNSEIKSVPVKSASEITAIAARRAVKHNNKMQIALIAACSALAVIIPFSVKTLLNSNAGITADNAYEAAASAPEKNVEFNESASEQESAAAAVITEADSSPKEENAQPNVASSENADKYKGAFSSQIINIEKKLPKGYKFVSVHEDNGSAEAEIAGEFGDTVTLTLSSADGAESSERLTEYDLGGIYAYGAAFSDYSYLTYEKDGVSYTLTSKYDLAELLDLAEDLEG